MYGVLGAIVEDLGQHVVKMLGIDPGVSTRFLAHTLTCFVKRSFAQVALILRNQCRSLSAARQVAEIPLNQSPKAPFMANSEIEALIESFTNQLQMLTKRNALEQVVAALGGASPAPKGGRGRPKGSKNKSTQVVKSAAPAAAAAPGKILSVRKGKRRTAADVEQMGQTLIAFVKANPGQRADQIAKALRTDAMTIRLPMQALLASKKLKSQGVRRGTKYFITGAAMSGKK